MRKKLKVIIPIIMAAIMLFIGGALFVNARAVTDNTKKAITSISFQWDLTDGLEKSIIVKTTDIAKINWGDGVVEEVERSLDNELVIHHIYQTPKKATQKYTVKILNDVITYLDCSNQGLTTLNTTNATNLNELICTNNKLKSVNVSKNTKLAVLDCQDNQIGSLNLKNTTNLIELNCANNKLKSLDLSKTLVSKLNCHGNQINKLALNGITTLTEIDCSGNKLVTLDLSSNLNLIKINCIQESMKEILIDENVTVIPEKYNNTKIVKTINGIRKPDAIVMAYQIDSNYIKNNAESTIYLKTNAITTIDWGDGMLQEVPASIEQELQLSHIYTKTGKYNIKIADDVVTYLDVKNNNITALDVSNNTSLLYLNCTGNKISKLDINKNIMLEELYCANNKLTNLDVSSNAELKELNCSTNKLKKLDVSKNNQLQLLDCSNNSLAGNLNVSKNIKLEKLSCYVNKLTNLDVSNNIKLKYLYCNDNKLTDLDVSNNLYLEELNCTQKTMKELVMDGDATVVPEKYEKTEIAYMFEANISMFPDPSKITGPNKIIYDPNTTDKVINMPANSQKPYGASAIVGGFIEPIREGYKFINWNDKKDGTGKSYSLNSMYTANADLTLYAQWEKMPSTKPTTLITPQIKVATPLLPSPTPKVSISSLDTSDTSVYGEGTSKTSNSKETTPIIATKNPASTTPLLPSPTPKVSVNSANTTPSVSSQTSTSKTLQETIKSKMLQENISTLKIGITGGKVTLNIK